MTRTLEMIITDAGQGDLFPLKGLIDFLLFDSPLTKEQRYRRLQRIYSIAYRKWKIPRNVAEETLAFLF